MHAPVAPFVYSRPDHTARTLEALTANELAADTGVTIYCDGAKSVEGREAVEATRAVARAARRFRSARAVERDSNMGLANSVITGVTQVCGERGRVNSIASFWAIHLRSPTGLPFHDWWMGMITEVFGTVALLNVPLLEYRRHRGNASTSSYRSRAPIADPVLRRTLMAWHLLLRWLGRTLFPMVLAKPQGRPA